MSCAQEKIVKLCWNCKHFLRTSEKATDGVCKLFYRVCYVTGQKDHVLAKKARTCEHMCGKEAKQYEPSEDTSTRYSLVYE